MTDFDWQADFLVWVGGLSPRDHQIVAQRACVDMGWPHKLDHESISFDGDHEDPEFQAALHKRYTDMYMGDLVDELVDDGKLVADRVHEDGNYGYVVA